MKPTVYELLALLDRSLRESVNLFKQFAESPGQRSDVLIPLSNEVQYVRAQAGFEVTTEASDYGQDQATHWSRYPSQVRNVAQRPGRRVPGHRGARRTA